MPYRIICVYICESRIHKKMLQTRTLLYYHKKRITLYRLLIVYHNSPPPPPYTHTKTKNQL